MNGQARKYSRLKVILKNIYKLKQNNINMNKLSLSIGLILLLSLSGVLAGQDTITINGQPKKPDNQIDYMYGIDVFDENGTKLDNVEEIINNNKGYFEVKGLEAPVEGAGPKTIWVMGGCFVHSLSISKKEGKYVITDAHFPDKMIMTTSSKNISLGALIEDKPNLVWVNSNTPVTFFAEDMDGNEVAFNAGYKKETGMSNSFKSDTKYKIILESEKGKKWEKTITTGNYCESTRIIKRGEYFVVENFPDNTLPPIGFGRGIKLWFKGLFS